MLNSAPVQLLPIDNGSGYKKTASEKINNAGPNEDFNKIFESATRAEKTELPEKGGEKVFREKESGKQKNETEAVKKRKKQKLQPDEDENLGAVSVQHEGKIETAVKELKSGLSSDSIKKGNYVVEAEDSDTVKRVKQFEAVKLKVSAVKKEAVRGGVKTAAETGLAGLSLKNAVYGKTAESKKTVSGEPKAGKLSGKLSEAAESMKKTTDVRTSVKPSIELVTTAAEMIKPSTADSKKNALKTGKATSKLRVVDHRHNQSVDSGKSFKIGDTAESGSFKAAINAAGSDVEINPSADLLKSESGSAETKTIKSSVLSQLKQTVNSQIVKQAGIIVKGNGTGEIKLVMKPENLGKVRIHLSLNDNHIAGRIIVENNIVREIFESNLENLYKAFGAEGFENGGLEVSVQGQGGDADGNGHRNGKAFNGREARAIEEAVPELADTEWQNNAVNMVV